MSEVRTVEHRSHVESRAERDNHVIAAPLLRFDLVAERDRLRRERPYTEGDRNAKTLVKSGRYRLVLVALRKGARFDEADPRGWVSMFVHDGRVSVDAADGTTEIAGGEVAALEPGQRWSAVALEESTVLINVNWPPES